MQYNILGCLKKVFSPLIYFSETKKKCQRMPKFRKAVTASKKLHLKIILPQKLARAFDAFPQTQSLGNTQSPHTQSVGTKWPLKSLFLAQAFNTFPQTQSLGNTQSPLKNHCFRHERSTFSHRRSRWETLSPHRRRRAVERVPPWRSRYSSCVIILPHSDQTL